MSELADIIKHPDNAACAKSVQGLPNVEAEHYTEEHKGKNKGKEGGGNQQLHTHGGPACPRCTKAGRRWGSVPCSPVGRPWASPRCSRVGMGWG